MNAPELLQVDPKTLHLDKNIRTDVRLTDGFMDSIREDGVLEPLRARRTPLGEVLVVDGQRRLTAALQLDLAQVPVLITAEVGDDESRIQIQHTLNEHRAGLTTSEKAGAFEQMSLLGISPDQIARRLKVPPAQVEAGLAVAASKKATKALAAAPSLDLVNAAGIAEFEDDPETAKQLVKTAEQNPGQIAHALQRARDDRDSAAALAAKRAELEEAGVTVIARGWEIKGACDLDYLQGVDKETHTSCPGHAVEVRVRRRDDGYEAYVGDAYCLDYRKHGHKKPNASTRTTEEASPEEKAAASAARKRVLDNNASARASEVVRRAHIKDRVLKMGSYSVAALTYAAQVIAGYPHALNAFNYGELFKSFEVSVPDTASTRVRAERTLLAVALAAGELALTADQYWRTPPTRYYRLTCAPLGVLHLRALADAGYELTPLEREWLDSYVEPTPKAAA